MQNLMSELRQQGYRIYIFHDRIRKNKWVNVSSTTKILDEVISPKGGSTIVEIVSPDGDRYTGIADCSKRDCYNKKRGVAIALGRAIKTMNQLEVNHANPTN